MLFRSLIFFAIQLRLVVHEVSAQQSVIHRIFFEYVVHGPKKFENRDGTVQDFWDRTAHDLQHQAH